MKRSRSLVVLAVVVGVLASTIGVASGAAASFTTRSIATGSISQYDPTIDGKLVTWTEAFMFDVGSTQRIGIHDLDSGTTTYIGTTGADGDQRSADISSERIAYVSNEAGTEDIRVNDVRLVANYMVTNSLGNEVDPAIDGNLVVWRTEVDDSLWYRDLARGVTAQVPGASAVTAHDVDNGMIAWVSGRQVFSYRPGIAGVSATLEYTVSAPLSIKSLQMHGDYIGVTVYETDADARVIDVRHIGATDVNPDSVYDESFPSVFHKGVAWTTNQGGDQNVMFKVLGDAVGNVAGTTDDESSPSLYGRRVAYELAATIMSSDIWLGTGTREIARTSGTNRYATAAAVSAAYFSESDTVILCTGENFPDALSAAPLAKVMNVPMLLCRRDSMPAETAAEIARLQATNVVVIGSDAAISQSMLFNFSDSISWSRIEGTNRYETSAAIARQVELKTAGVFKPQRAFFARGDNFPDALAVGPVAAGAYAPVLLVPSTSVPAAITSVVDELNLTSGVVVGSASAVSAGVQDTLEALLIANGADPNPIERWSGSDRYATAIAVIEGGLEARWIDLDTLGVATGLNFPDALGGGATMAVYGSPLVLTGPTSVPGAVNTFLTKYEYDVGRVDVFGGTTVVSDAVKSAIAAKLK